MKRLAVLLLVLLAFGGVGPLRAGADSVRTDTTTTLRAITDDGRAAGGDGVDTIVTFSARDTVRFSVSRKTMRLRGRAEVFFRTQKLEAEVITMDFGPSTMSAQGVQDSSGRTVGFPVFTDNGEEYAGQRIDYNFRTKRGRVLYGETSIDGGIYYGAKIKRVGTEMAYIEDGVFTTCEAPHPHFYFTSPEMKVVANDKLFLDPVIWYVEDIPVFAIPFGLFVSLERGRRSGLVLPTPLFSSNRGFVLNGLGYYFAISDYMDADITADLMTVGGVVLRSKTNYAVADRMSGNLQLTYGQTRNQVEEAFVSNVGIAWEHRQSLRPGETVGGTLNYTSQGLFQNTSININDRLRQEARTNLSYQRTFYNEHTFNVSYAATQNMITGSINQTPSIRYSVPQFMPLRPLIGGDGWLRDLALTYSATGLYENNRNRPGTTGAFTVRENSWIEHRPAVTVTPKLGYFGLTPSFSYSENWHFQRYSQAFNAADSTVSTTREQGFFREYTYNVGIGLTTRLYGVASPNVWGITAFRHTLEPTVRLSYSPDLSAEDKGMFGYVTSSVTGQRVAYRRFHTALASAQEQLAVDLSLLNRFAIKVAGNDTTPDKPIDLLTVEASTRYNMAADSLRLSPISVNIRAPFLQGVQFNTRATFDVYDQVLAPDPITGVPVWQQIDRTVLGAGKGLARLTSFNLQLGTSFSSNGISFASRNTTADTAATDSVRSSLRDRFDQRINHRETDVDLFGERTPGYGPVLMPWDMTVSLSYGYSATNPDATSTTLLVALDGNLALTETLRTSFAATFDLVSGRVNTPNISVNKIVDCWAFAFTWVPSGFNRGFFLSFSAVAPQLKDLRIIRQSTPVFR